MPAADFTDCPWTALQYATGRRGVLLVVDLPADARERVSEELWFNGHAARLMLWGRFDKYIVARIPAKELRAHVRKKGVVTASPLLKSSLLRQVIEKLVGILT
jgi:hypothetical protein